MRETQIITWCDACQARGKNTKITDGESEVTVNLAIAGRPATLDAMTLDLCKADRKALIDPLVALIDEYGVPKPAPTNGHPHRGPRSMGRPSSRTDRDKVLTCPKCDEPVRGSRRNVIAHLTNNHGLDSVAASKLVPTVNGRSVPCPICGYITDGGTGLGAHIRPVHGADAWEQVKAERVVQ